MGSNCYAKVGKRCQNGSGSTRRAVLSGFALAAALSCISVGCFADTANGGPAPGNVGNLSVLFYLVISLVTVVWMVGLGRALQWLRKDSWNFAQAVSEEATLPDGTPPPGAGQLPPLVASSSRLIALLGAVIMAAFFIGLGYWVIWALFNGQPIDKAKDTLAFFLSGTALFTPYAANKVASIFQS